MSDSCFFLLLKNIIMKLMVLAFSLLADSFAPLKIARLCIVGKLFVDDGENFR
jgi:hypothetical protein